MKKTMIILIMVLALFIFAIGCTPTKVDVLTDIPELKKEMSDKMLSEEKMLPIGSVVMVKGTDNPIMIIGKMQYLNGDESTLYDYSGVDYPVGLIDPTDNYLFNQDTINQILFVGYETAENEALNSKIMEIKNQS